jgi:hypothetical protein
LAQFLFFTLVAFVALQKDTQTALVGSENPSRVKSSDSTVIYIETASRGKRLEVTSRNVTLPQMLTETALAHVHPAIYIQRVARNVAGLL